MEPKYLECRCGKQFIQRRRNQVHCRKRCRHHAYEVKRTARRITRGGVDATKVKRVDGETHSSEFAEKVSPEADAALAEQAPAKVREVMADDLKIEGPSATAFALVKEYHGTVKPGGDYYKAVENVQAVMDGPGGWTVERLRACMQNHRRLNEEKWRQNAARFFEPLSGGHGLFQGAQWEPRANAKPTVTSSLADVRALAALLKEKAGVVQKQGGEEN